MCGSMELLRSGGGGARSRGQRALVLVIAPGLRGLWDKRERAAMP